MQWMITLYVTFWPTQIFISNRMQRLHRRHTLLIWLNNPKETAEEWEAVEGCDSDASFVSKFYKVKSTLRKSIKWQEKNPLPSFKSSNPTKKTILSLFISLWLKAHRQYCKGIRDCKSTDRLYWSFFSFASGFVLESTLMECQLKLLEHHRMSWLRFN